MSRHRATEALPSTAAHDGDPRAGHRQPGRPRGLRSFLPPRARRVATSAAVAGLVIGGGVLVAAPASAQVATLWGGANPTAYISEDEGRPLTLGTRFTADVSGFALGIRFWKDAGADGSHDGALWSGDGRQLATVTFDDESESGWQTASFAKPVRLEQGEEYVVAYHVPDGEYAATVAFFGSSRSEELSVREGSSGVYAYGDTTRFPTQTWRSSQYWVDVTFRPDRPAPRWWPGWWGGPWWGRAPSPSPTTPAPTSTSPDPSDDPTTPPPSEEPEPTPTPTATPGSPTPTATPTEGPGSPTPSSPGSPSATPRPTPSTAPKPTPSTTPKPTPAPTPAPANRPGPSNTGVPDGRALTPSGSLTVDRAGTVIDGLAVSGTITVTAPNVVIRNSTVSGSGSNGIYVRSGSATITDSTITGFENAIAGDSWTAQRVDIYGTTGDGVKLGSNVSLLDSWIHDLTPGPGAHADGAQLQSGEVNVLVRGNTIDVSASDTANAALFLAPDLGPSTDGPMVIEGNWLDGGNFTLFCVDGNYGQYLVGNISIVNNRFGRAAQYGPVRINVPVTFSGNVWDDNGRPVSQ